MQDLRKKSEDTSLRRTNEEIQNLYKDTRFIHKLELQDWDG